MKEKSKHAHTAAFLIFFCMCLGAGNLELVNTDVC